MSPAPLSWVLGADGLLGSSVVDLVGDGQLWHPQAPIDWSDAGAAGRVRDATAAFLAAARGGPWQVYWCAGAAVTGSSPAELSTEQVTFQALLDGLRLAPDPDDGGLFVASSAGGVYAGSSGPPYHEQTPPRPISPYGMAKLAQEDAARRLAGRTGLPMLIGRLANLYGPRQNLAKPQGIISQIARAHVLQEPISIYVPLDTTRDYLFAPDAARRVADGMRRLRTEAEAGRPGPVTKVIATQHSTTVGFLVSEFRRISRRSPRVTYTASSVAAYQARDLRLRSRVWSELDAAPTVPLPVGIHRVLTAAVEALGRGRLH